MTEGKPLVSVSEAANLLGVSRGMVYGLAAPHGPIPCYRIGKRIIFDWAALEDYKISCQFTETKNTVVSSINSGALSTAKDSGLSDVFRSYGVKPKLTASTGRNQPASTPSQPDPKKQNSPLKTPLQLISGNAARN